MERFVVGGKCERQWDIACRNAKATAISASTKFVRDPWSKAKAIPIHERKRWHESLAGKDYLDDVRFAMQEDQGINLVADDADPARVVRIAPKRPKGLRPSIIDEVAKKYDITPRMAEKCWKAFRALVRESG